MTWGEFKEKMQRCGVTDDTPIVWIITNEPEEAIATFTPEGSVYISDV